MLNAGQKRACVCVCFCAFHFLDIDQSGQIF